MNLTPDEAADIIEQRDEEATRTDPDLFGLRKSLGASGKWEARTLKENPYARFELEAVASTWFGSVGSATLKFALFILNGFIWEARNGDRFVGHHARLHDMEQQRDRIQWLLSLGDGTAFWPQQEEWEQIALIDFVRLLPFMWD